MYYSFSIEYQLIGWLFLFLAFAVKVPVYPFHIWLPEAHVEAPTVGSILLAGILLKLGPYGIIKFSNLLFPFGLYYYRPLVILLCLLGIYYTSLIAIRQIDIKKIIAYSSVGHMALIVLVCVIGNYEGLLGGFLLLIAHGFVSAGLFLLIGLVYDRYGTRLIYYYNGLIMYNIKLVYFFFFLLL
jgi:NADH:ubiquinone oxidoreductase subunit 4 (subunit M)